jgi:RNA polymerase sigma factor (sigma-70 family)
MKRAQILTTEQEVSLLDSFRAGDDEAGAALALGYSPLIEATAHHFYRLNQRFADKQDLISVGFEGFMTALQSAKQRFDCSHGNRLGTYVRPWIHHFIASYIRRERWWAPSIPDRIHRKVVRLSIAERQLRQDLGRQPDIAELAAALSLSPEETRTLVSVRPNPSAPVRRPGA